MATGFHRWASGVKDVGVAFRRFGGQLSLRRTAMAYQEPVREAML